MSYVRSSDGKSVPDSEALDAIGRINIGYRPAMLQPGEHIGFSHAFADTHPARGAGRVTFHDGIPAKAAVSGGEAVRNMIRDSRHNPASVQTSPVETTTLSDDSLRAVRDRIRDTRNS
jgi:hypothetical protein